MKGIHPVQAFMMLPPRTCWAISEFPPPFPSNPNGHPPAGNVLAAGFRSADPQKLRDLLGDDFPICNVAASNHHLEKGRKLSTILWIWPPHSNSGK